MTTRRWTDDGTTWFAISGVGPEVAASAEHVLMDYQRHGDEWRRGYPADTPGLDICWQNFASCAGLMLRQAARLQPVPWRETLHELCRRTSGRESSWWLAGSTALAVRGARIEPGDIDLVCSGDGALRLGVIFADAIIEPVVHDASSPVSEYWGRAFLGARLEWIGAPKAGVDFPSPSDFGPVAATRLETVTWEGCQLRVPPLDLQRAVSQRRGLTDRVALIDAIRITLCRNRGLFQRFARSIGGVWNPHTGRARWSATSSWAWVGQGRGILRTTEPTSTATAAPATCRTGRPRAIRRSAPPQAVRGGLKEQ